MSSAPASRHPFLRPRRIGVTGGTEVSQANADFCRKLGFELAGEEGLVLVTGGFRHEARKPGGLSADYCIAEGAWGRIEKEKLPPERLETMLPQNSRDDHKIIRFQLGKVVELRNRNPQSRRFCLVNSTDVVVGVQGNDGTAQMIDLALALEKPCLPLPFSGGKSAERWHDNRAWIREWFGIDDETAARLEDSKRAATEAGRADLARMVTNLLIRKLNRKCFVIMPFQQSFQAIYDRAIKPGALRAGFVPLRADELPAVGNAVESLRSAIHACDCAVAVLTTFNPNVMYELGFAHAEGKPVVLVCHVEPHVAQLPNLPFDLRNERVIGYEGHDYPVLEEKVYSVLEELKRV